MSLTLSFSINLLTKEAFMKKLLLLGVALSAMLSLGATAAAPTEVEFDSPTSVIVQSNGDVESVVEINEVEVSLNKAYPIYTDPMGQSQYLCSRGGDGKWKCVKVIALGDPENPRPDK